MEIKSLNSQLAELKKLKTSYESFPKVTFQDGYPKMNTYFVNPAFAQKDMSPPPEQQSFSTPFKSRPPFQPSEPQPFPLAPVQIYFDQNHPPIHVTAFFDTGAAQTIANPQVLPPSFWKEHKNYFKSANADVFSTDYVSKKVTIQIFPTCSTKLRIIGSTLPGKDLVIGFDVISSIKGLKLDDKDSHEQLLQRFQQIVQDFGIMLSEKKMTIGTSEINFLGMHIKEGKYVAHPHIGQALQDFPNENLTKKQIQQFLGIVNYMSDFLSNLAKLSNPLKVLLKENPPQWSQKQTTTVKVLKAKALSLPTLHIPSNGTRILQTGASNKY
ncbi:reverse transcriptase [Corchorus capsularis]|uniref:Reverse transcriptase n=1 Tax=Corchorus capsularis TaxID=210143 RepID=A0A1R3IU93_COCAP|nr:reverse transcriptase [Corchorus capsularis]